MRISARHAHTKTDSAADEWAIKDGIVQLRRWGTDVVHILPDPPYDICTVGAAGTCGLRLSDPTGRVSRVHARLVRDAGNWVLHDLDSKNGIRSDGARRADIVLQPGLEIGIGGVILVAESPLSIALRSFLSRLLGWQKHRNEAADEAMRSIRMATTRHAPLVICGDGDLVPTARSIHCHSRGRERRFVVCDPRRQSGKATVRSPENMASGMEAFRAATGGTVCVRRERLPHDFRELVRAVRVPGSQVQLMVCADVLDELEQHRVMPIVIPSLATRRVEVDRIIREYVEDAMTELGMAPGELRDPDHAWIRAHSSASLPDIEKATMRMVALRSSPSITNAAMRLGMAPVSLLRWIERWGLPLELAE